MWRNTFSRKKTEELLAFLIYQYGKPVKALNFASKCEQGDKILFTDALGVVFNYTVSSVKHSEKITEDVLESHKADMRIVVKTSGGYSIIKADS